MAKIEQSKGLPNLIATGRKLPLDKDVFGLNLDLDYGFSQPELIEVDLYGKQAGDLAADLEFNPRLRHQ